MQKVFLQLGLKSSQRSEVGCVAWSGMSVRSLSAGWIQLGYTARSYRHKVWTTRMNTQVLTNKSGEIFLSIFIFFRFSFYTDAQLLGVSENCRSRSFPGIPASNSRSRNLPFLFPKSKNHSRSSLTNTSSWLYCAVLNMLKKNC